ncbi:MAG: hypothetical protein C0502_10950 [Opitutus sp.]|nr:hypothetical protein [Opitutus sp.]
MPTHPAHLPAAVALALFELADQTMRDAQRARRHARRRRIGETLRPGAGTPLWNELAKQALPLLAKRGAKAQLARQLGISRQRLRHCLKAQRACLDGERALMLLCWVAARQRGRPLPLQAEPGL